VVRKMSSMEIRDCTKLRLSVAIRSPATPAHSVLPNNRRARIDTSNTETVPKIAGITRQPKGLFPNQASPPATIQRPSGGWTVAVCSAALSSLHWRNGMPASRQPSFA
jgi:hypothetical protein